MHWGVGVPAGKGLSRPRVLFLTCHLPYPPISGGRRREFELIKRLSDRFDIHVCAVTKTLDRDRVGADALREYCSGIDLFPKRDLQPSDAFDGSARCSLTRQNASADLSACVQRLLATADLIHAEGFYMVQHVPRGNRVPTLLVEQNLEYLLWRQRAHLVRRIEERTPLVMEYLRTLRDETTAWATVQAIGTVTDDDRRHLVEAEPSLDVRVLPDGVDHLATAPASNAPAANARPRVALIANFAYEPNIDAALYLCREIMPRIRRHEPDVVLWLVGNSPPPEVWEMASDDVIVTGTVPDVGPYLDAADVIVCPLRVGGGIKVKVLEAMFRGKAVVTSTVGAQGLSGSNGALAIHDEPGRFARTVVDLLGDPARRLELGAEARAFALTLPTWDEAARAVEETYLDLLRGRYVSGGRSFVPGVKAQPAR